MEPVTIIGDDGEELDAHFSVETSGTRFAVTLESRSGTKKKNPRNLD